MFDQVPRPRPIRLARPLAARAVRFARPLIRPAAAAALVAGGTASLAVGLAAIYWPAAPILIGFTALAVGLLAIDIKPKP